MRPCTVAGIFAVAVAAFAAGEVVVAVTAAFVAAEEAAAPFAAARVVVAVETAAESVSAVAVSSCFL